MKAIGFAGTAKNTGKTTTVLSVLRSLHASGKRTALTSIGYDGEQLDTVTGLPKPRYNLAAGDLVATSAECLDSGTARVKILQATSLKTILGRVVIAEIVQEGTVLVAGPNRQRDVAELIEQFRLLGADLLLVDGALNRLAPMILCDGVVLATGAAYSSDIDTLTRHIATLVRFFDLPIDTTTTTGTTHCTLYFTDGSSKSLPTANWVDTLALESSIVNASGLKKMVIPGIARSDWLNRLAVEVHAADGTFDPIQLVLGSPLRMITSGHIEQWASLLANSTVQVSVLRSIPLLCLTVNPFFPRRSQRGNAYEPAFADRTELLRSVRGAVRAIPVFDLQAGAQPDWQELLGIREEQM